MGSNNKGSDDSQARCAVSLFMMRTRTISRWPQTSMCFRFLSASPGNDVAATDLFGGPCRWLNSAPAKIICEITKYHQARVLENVRVRLCNDASDGRDLPVEYCGILAGLLLFLTDICQLPRWLLPCVAPVELASTACIREEQMTARLRACTHFVMSVGGPSFAGGWDEAR